MGKLKAPVANRPRCILHVQPLALPPTTLSRGPPHAFRHLARQIEYIVISYDDEHKNARLSLRQTEILQDLQADADERRRTPSREESPVVGNGNAEGEDVGAKVTEDGKAPQKNNELRLFSRTRMFSLLPD